VNRAVRKLGVEPGDKGLRNVMWDRETKKWSVLCPSTQSNATHPSSCYPRVQLTATSQLTPPTSGLVDFEMWDPYIKPPEPNDLPKDLSAEASLTELRKWGLAHKPPAKNWWAEFGIVTA
jgi:hypothetical protein